jgi:DnaJ-class molecular chaperone
MPKVKQRDYYEVLGLPRSASQKEISAAFRKLARKNHPDVNQGDKQAEARFKEASEANEVLSDPERRKLYDGFGHNWQAAQSAGINPNAAGAASPRSGARTVYTGSPDELREIFGAEGGFSDLFGSIFNRGSRGRGRVQTEFESTISITLQEAYSGCTRTMELPDGRRIELKVPAGIAEGAVLRLPGVLATVHLLPDPTFSREGRDLNVIISVPLRDVLLGGEVEVPTLKGSRVKLRVPAETQNGTRLRLRGLGLPAQGKGSAGDLYAEVRVRLPYPLDDEGRDWAGGTPPS